MVSGECAVSAVTGRMTGGISAWDADGMPPARPWHCLGQNSRAENASERVVEPADRESRSAIEN